MAVDTRQVSAASDTVVSRRIHRKSECVPTVVPKLAAAPQAASEVVQPRPRDYSCTDLRPPVGECLESLGIDTSDAGESGMEVAGGSPPADIDISVGPDVLPTATSMTTEVKERWIEIDTSDPVESGMEVAGGSPPAVIDIIVGPDVLQTAVSVMAVVSEEWMERFVINLDVLCSDGLASAEDPAGGSSVVGSDICVVPDPLPTAVSVRTVVAEKWMNRFVVDLLECLSVSRTSAVTRTFGPAVSEEYSPVVFAGGGGGGCRCIPPGCRRVRYSASVCLQLLRCQIQRECLSCLSPVVISRPFFGGRSPWMWSVWALARRVSRVDSEETLLTLTDERAQLARAAPGITPVDSSEKGAPVWELIRPSVLGEPLVVNLQEPTPVEKRSEYAIQATASVWEPLEQVHCVVSGDVGFDSFGMAPWDAGGMHGGGCCLCETFWTMMFQWLIRLSCRPVIVNGL